MSAIATPVLFVTLIGVISGVVLAVADKYMSVPTDERVEEITEALPGVNCGACGYAGCNEYAEMLVAKGVATNLCTPGGDEVSAEISRILGLPVLDVIEKVAQVHCAGDCHHSTYIMDYGGRPTCADSNSFFEGRHSCSYACLGFGDCLEVCQYDAISIVDNVAIIDRERCTGCGMCIETCPNHLIVMEDLTSKVFIACSSFDRGAFVRKICQIGCIGCKLCQRTCNYDAITIHNNLASIDPEKCTNCGDCVEVCPTNVIKEHLYELV